MDVRLPKDSAGFQFPTLFSAQMDEFDVERLLPTLFYLAVTKGRQRGKRVNDATATRAYLNALCENEALVGFEDEPARELLDKWLRTSIVHMGTMGKAHRGEQIQYLVPLTLMVYKSGLPTEIRRQRNVHTFLYEALMTTLRAAQAPNPEQLVLELFKDAFGDGVETLPSHDFDARYDETTGVDLQALLSMRYLEGFAPTPPAPSSGKKADRSQASGPALPATARHLGEDMLQYMSASRGSSTEARVQGLMALVNFELLVYTLRLAYATNALVREGTLPDAMGEGEDFAEPEIYVDFTGERGSASDTLARACVERHMEEIAALFDSAILLRTLHTFTEFLPAIQNGVKGRPDSTPAYLQLLIDCRRAPEVEASAHHELRSIAKANADEEKNEGPVDVSRFLEEAGVEHSGSALDACARVLANAQRSIGVTSYMKWYRAVGGVGKPFGLLSGNERGRRNWRYAMGDDLLACLVQLAMSTDAESATFTSARPLRRLRLAELLQWFEHRFGVLIDRPPRHLDDTESRAAAKANLEAFRRRLRQMGFFEALSDDFNAQYLTNRFTNGDDT